MGCCETDEMWSTVAGAGAEAGGGGGEAPVSRCKHAAALLAGDGGGGGGGAGGSSGEHSGPAVLLLGGRGARGTTPLTDFWRYDLATGQWRRMPSLGSPPGALQEHSALAHGRRLYVFGGEAALSHETPLWVYDMQTCVWRKLAGCPPPPARARPRPRAPCRAPAPAPASPAGRRGHSAHALPDCMLLYGGYLDLRGSTSELWAFHYESESWQLVRVSGAAPARHRHAAALLHERLYVHGGRCDLKACADLWYYHTISHVWKLVRTPAKLSPAARSGHAGFRVGPFFYIYGGEVDGHATNELWRFHFSSETWERMEQGLQWPMPRVDCAALLVGSAPPGASGAVGRGGGGQRGGGGGGGAARRGARPDSLLARLGAGVGVGAGGRRGEYLALTADGSAESLAPLPLPLPLPKSRSAYAVAPRPMARSRPSVPDFGDLSPPQPVPALTAGEAQLVTFEPSPEPYGTGRGTVPLARPHRPPQPDDEPTSDYASAERLGFTNPHYLWGGTGTGTGSSGGKGGECPALTPDSGAQDLELAPLAPPSPSPRAPLPRYLLLLGGREAHPARQQAPLSVWLCRLP